MKKILMFSLFLATALSAENSSLLHVSGTGKVFVKATLAEVRLGVEIEGKSSSAVQKELSRNLNQLTEALKKDQLIKLDTSSFSVYPEYSHDSPPQIKGYRGNGEILIKVASDQAGEFITLGMNSGATKVNGIELKASKEAIDEAKSEAIKEACAQAMLSAKAAFEALKVEMNEIVDINLNPINSFPHPLRRTMAFNAVSEANSGPDLEGEEAVEVQVSLQISFK